MRAGLPHDPAALGALGAAVLVVALAPRLLRAKASRLIAYALTALVLSALYVVVYLRGGPRIVDATMYWLEGRALSEGHLAFTLFEPATSTMGRFLVRPDGASAAAGIFPPGFPAVLALGFLARAPLAVGPILAAIVVAATWALARRVAPGEPIVAPIAALMSVVCAALRYHTADTMSHGLAAACFAGALALGLAAHDARARAASRRALGFAVAAGALAGWLGATRPASALALLATAIFAWISHASAASRAETTRHARLSLALAAAIGAVPGLALLVAHQHAATGHWFASSQGLYYALADGPPGCFTYGFGDGIGCVGEHGDFVRAHLADGYGLLAALGTTARRLRMHLVDVANAEPLFLLVPIGAFLARGERRARVFVFAIAAQIVAYAPFYFDGNYPGGGARLFADVLPLEHVLVAIAAARLAAKTRWPLHAAAAPIALALIGFSVRAGSEHAALRDREGGRPMFEPAVLTAAGVDRGLVFFDTDPGFDLAFDPDAKPDGIAAARRHGDDLDHLTWEARGKPAAYRYDFDFDSGRAAVHPFAFPLDPPPDRVIEGESLWPPIAQRDAWALSTYATGTCASAGRMLRVWTAGANAEIALELPAALAGLSIAPSLVLAGDAGGLVAIDVDGTRLPPWRVAGTSPALACVRLAAVTIPPGARKIRVLLAPEHLETASIFALDRLDIATSKYVDQDPGKVRDSQGIR